MSAAKLISELPVFWPEHQTEGPDVVIRKVQICSAEADQKVGVLSFFSSCISGIPPSVMAAPYFRVAN